jgi:hypothetical protein
MSEKHSILCKKASNFLKGNNWKKVDINGQRYNNMRCGIVFIEKSTWNIEQPDVIGFNTSNSTVIECKLSRADFLSDKKKKFRINSKIGMGNYRYYYCPHGLIKHNELPNKWGLIYLSDRSHVFVKLAEHQECDFDAERRFLYSMLLRDGISNSRK